MCCFREETAVLADDRIRTINEVITDILIIMMYRWEKPYTALLDNVRRYINLHIYHNFFYS